MNADSLFTTKVLSYTSTLDVTCSMPVLSAVEGFDILLLFASRLPCMEVIFQLGADSGESPFSEPSAPFATPIGIQS